MVPFSTTTRTYTSNVVLEVTIESLMLAVFNFEISEITSTMLSGQRSLFHVDVLLILVLFVFLWIEIVP